MPTYVYKCASCSETMNIFHPFSEVISDCKLCGVENSLQKDYSTPFNTSKTKKQNNLPVGQVTNDFIERTKEEVKQEKENLTKEYLNE
jgi:putative FmdB family regulatory protein